MWHASVCHQLSRKASDDLIEIARDELNGVGDASLGEWIERGDIAVHIRRRLSAAEEPHVGPVRDVRGTFEAQKRLNRMRRYLPEPMRRLPDAVLP